MQVIAQNKKASHDYHIEDRFEAGIELAGGEVKSIKAGHVSIKEAYVQVRRGQAWLVNAYVKPYAAAGGRDDPTRDRRLLLHAAEIAKLAGAARSGNRTVVPTKVFLKQALIKVEVALGQGKKVHDKRQALKARQAKREAAQAVKDRD